MTEEYVTDPTDSAATIEPTAVGAFDDEEILFLLAQRSGLANHVRRVFEEFSMSNQELVREVSIDIRHRSPSMLYVALTPRKGVLQNLDFDANQGSLLLDRLCHDDHKDMESALLVSRFLQWWRTIEIPSNERPEPTKALLDIMTRLSPIPYLDSIVASKRVAELFDGTGTLGLYGAR